MVEKIAYYHSSKHWRFADCLCHENGRPGSPSSHGQQASLSIDMVMALKMFCRSDTRARLHDKSTGLYPYGDLYIADEFIPEMQNR